MENQKKEWKMPEWMEPFREYIYNTGGNSIEDLMNDHESNTQNNVVRTMLCIAVKSEVALLERLKKENLLIINK